MNESQCPVGVSYHHLFIRLSDEHVCRILVSPIPACVQDACLLRQLAKQALEPSAGDIAYKWSRTSSFATYNIPAYWIRVI